MLRGKKKKGCADTGGSQEEAPNTTKGKATKKGKSCSKTTTIQKRAVAVSAQVPEPVVPAKDPEPVVPAKDPEPVVPAKDPEPVIPAKDPEPVVPARDPETQSEQELTELENEDGASGSKIMS